MAGVIVADLAVMLADPESPESPAGRRSSSAALAPPGGRPDPNPGVTDSQLAVLLRQTHWTLDDAAYDLPAGQVSAQQREDWPGPWKG